MVVLLCHHISNFIHALLAESDTFNFHLAPFCTDFYPRSPCGERLHVRVQCPYSYRISIHALLAESDEGNNRIWVYFQISIHALLAESDNIPLPNAHIIAISIHALLAESDNGHETSPYRVVISIHALLAESDLRLMFFGCVGGYFYPRSPRGERRQALARSRRRLDFYPRSPCGERRIFMPI